MARIRRWRAFGAEGAPPLVLVHGLGVSSRYLVPVAERLAAERRVLAPDLADEPADVPGRARVLGAWLDELDLPRVPLLANSLGCQIGAELAVAEPDRVAALVLVGPTVDPRARSLLRQAARLVATAPFERPSLVPLVALEYGSHPLGTLRAARRMVEHRLEEQLPQVVCPVLVVRGSHDRICPQAWGEEVARLGRGRLEVLRGGHALNFTSPDELAAATTRFLDGAR
jgi:pimeloyl-ACP methyl ester carboxylesterase